MDQKFSKKERIYHRDDINALFKTGQQQFVYPFKLFVTIHDREDQETPVSILITTPAKKYKRAFLRNRLKRLIRESYRLNKAMLHDLVPEDKKLHIAFVFVGDPEIDFHKMNDRMIRTMETLKTKLIKF
jgi:ribonuclease P protein component